MRIASPEWDDLIDVLAQNLGDSYFFEDARAPVRGGPKQDDENLGLLDAAGGLGHPQTSDVLFFVRLGPVLHDPSRVFAAALVEKKVANRTAPRGVE
jgi:hypothetical protein